MSKHLHLHSDPTVRAFVEAHAPRCAAVTVTGTQLLREQIILAALLAFFCYDWKLFIAAGLFALSAMYVLIIAYRLLTVLISLAFRPEMRVSKEEIAALNDEDLPVYTILVPLYKEANIARKLIRALNRLDYPPEKLDVKLLLEQDDTATIRACRRIEMLARLDVIVVADAKPKTKPKACNHGLRYAEGEYVVIYDAEDRPEPDQLKKAVAAFAKVPERVICLQAKLNYYNAFQNILTRWFTLEYSAWFDLYLPGLHALDVPIPLGGTSNHFRTKVLQELEGWDPYNLTEDCDLGIRLHRYGFRTMTLDSTTWEEANSQIGNWLRQRSRWVKGYIQTHLAHTRSHTAALRELGPKGYLSFLLTVGGLSATLLLNPFFWAVGLVYLGLYGGHALALTPSPWRLIYNDRVSDLPESPLTLWSLFSHVFYWAAVALLAANALFVLVNLIACVKRRLWGLLPLALLSPLYWILISIAAWKGFFQLFSRPFYWEKTTHGLTPKKKRAPAPSGGTS